MGKQSLLQKGRGLVESFHIGKERTDLGLILLSLHAMSGGYMTMREVFTLSAKIPKSIFCR